MFFRSLPALCSGLAGIRHYPATEDTYPTLLMPKFLFFFYFGHGLSDYLTVRLLFFITITVNGFSFGLHEVEQFPVAFFDL